MSVRIKCFASLRQQLGIDSIEVEHRSDMTVGDGWRALSAAPPPPNLLCARNFEYAEFDSSVADGDEIAFFPPVTGG
ncbi:MAG: MoaD/ThiS family protein [bacterium]